MQDLKRNSSCDQTREAAEIMRLARQIGASAGLERSFKIAAGGVNGQPLPLVRDDARFNDKFSSFDLRLSKAFRFGEKARLEPIRTLPRICMRTHRPTKSPG